MKRILSIFLCVAMLMSMASLAVSAVGELESEITTKNVMTFTTDKDSYAPGETVTIAVAMESIWGDPDLEGDIYGYEDMVMPGAYGMNILCSTLIYDTSVFTANKHTNLLPDGGINNVDAVEVSVSGNNPVEAKTNGAYYLMAESDTFNANYDAYGYFTGAGDLWEYSLTIAADAAPGTYYLPVGPYKITENTNTAVIKFADFPDKLWVWNGNIDSLLTDREVEYKTNYTGESRVAADSPKGAEYECSYVAITVEGDGTIDPPTPPVVEDPMAFTLTPDKAEYVPGDIVTVDFAVKDNEGLTEGSADITFNNTNLKLVEVTSPVEGFGTAGVNYDAANKIGSFDALDTPVTADVYFDGTTEYTEDGIILTAKFEVLTTAETGEDTITVANHETGLEAAATVSLNTDGHTHSFEDNIVDPTCNTQGTTTKVCSCGLSYLIATTPSKGHTPSTNEADIKIRPATCTEPGATVTACSVCGGTAKSETTEALGHDLKTVKTELTCTTDETSKEVCQREGCKYESETVVINKALAHKNPDGTDAWGEAYVATDPTTYSIGYMGKDCALCGDVFRYEEIPMRAIVYGDCNMDDNINLLDVSVLLMRVANWEGLWFSPENADVLADSRLNVLDASKLLKYIAGWKGIILGQGATVVG